MPEKAGDMVELCADLAREAFPIASSWLYLRRLNGHTPWTKEEVDFSHN